jgi:hypothetical protein
MGSRRTDSIDLLLQLVPQIELHLAYLRAEPDSRAANHWRGEVRVWLRRMERELGRIGKRSRAEWSARMTAWWLELGE